MTLNEAVKKIENKVESKLNKNKSVEEKVQLFIDEKRLGHDLVSNYGQNINNLTLPLNALETIALAPVSLPDYANLNHMSYSSIYQNKGSYATLFKQTINQNSTYTVSRYELCHPLRTNKYGDRGEYFINNDKSTHKVLIELSEEYNTDPGTALYRLLQDIRDLKYHKK